MAAAKSSETATDEAAWSTDSSIDVSNHSARANACAETETTTAWLSAKITEAVLPRHVEIQFSSYSY